MRCLSEAPAKLAGPARRGARPWLKQFGLLLALVLICAGLGVSCPNFATVSNIITVARQISINGILAVGVTFVLLTGGVDLSLGSLVALTGVVAASFAHPNQCPLIVPLAMGVVTGLACGLVSGTVITLGRIAPFIATLGMMTAARGLALVISNGKPVSNMSRAMTSLGDDFLGIPIPVWVLATVAVLSWIFLVCTRPGRYIYAVGGNENAARAAGIRVRWVKTFAYCVSGALAGVAGIVLAARTTTGQPNAGVAFELDAITAAVIGGTSLSGGVGSIMGTVLGALLLGILNNGLDQLGVPSYYQQIVKGVIIVGAALMDRKPDRR